LKLSQTMSGSSPDRQGQREGTKEKDMPVRGNITLQQPKVRHQSMCRGQALDITLRKRNSNAAAVRTSRP
jgi:hypothetical protein